MRYDIFPTIERKIFKWTFLKDVSLSVMFKVKKDEVSDKAISDFFQQTFGIAGLNKESLGKEKGVRFQSGDKCIGFDFSFTKVDLKIKYPLYKEFAIILRWLPIVMDFLGISGVEEVSNLTLRKYNELVFSMPHGREDIPLAMKEIFSQALLGDNFDEEAKSFNTLNRWERKTVIEDAERESEVNISFGFCEKYGVSPENALTLNTSIATKDRPVPIADIESRLPAMNLVMDRAFRWCVTDSIITQMEGSNE